MISPESLADQLDTLSRQVASLQSRFAAQDQAALEVALSPADVLRVGSYPSGAEVYPAGTTTPGFEGILSDNAVVAGNIAPGAVTTAAFAPTIRPITLVTVLPTLPSATYPAGSFVYKTNDSPPRLYKNVADVWVAAIGPNDIAADSITAGQIAAGAISATELAATLILASLIKTADSGTRVEFDRYGIRAYNGSTLIVNVPTDGSDVYIAAEVQASALTVTGDASLRGSGSEVAASGVLTLQSTVANPVTAPSLTQDWDTLSVPASTWGWSMDYDPAGGAGGATKVFWGVKAAGYIGEYLCSDRTLNRSKLVDGASDLIWGVCRHGSYVYVLYHPDGSATWNVRRFLASTLALDATYAAVSFPRATPEAPSIASDGTNIFIADRAAADNHLIWNKYDATMVKVGATIDTGVVFALNVLDIHTGNADFGAWRLVAVGATTSQTYVFDSTGARQTNDEFPLTGSGTWSGVTYGDAVGDGARFWTSQDFMLLIVKHTTWNWTTASSIYWVAYSWYDSVGTTHETLVGPRASITMGKRKRLLVTTPREPGSGGADEPDNRRIYAYPNATAPATTLLDLQATTTSESYYLTTYDSGGAAPPVANGFPAGTPAQIKSADTGWTLRGSGLINRAGTAFPGGAVTGDHFFRSDIGEEFWYDGTRWRCTRAHALVLSDNVGGILRTTGLTATTAAITKGMTPFTPEFSDIYLIDHIWLWQVIAGTALGASHKWVLTLAKQASTAGDGTLATVTLDSGSTSTYYRGSAALDGTIQSAHVWHTLKSRADKTGTPGNLLWEEIITYNHVAT